MRKERSKYINYLVKPLLDEKFLLGENIIWDHNRELLLWTDIEGKTFNSCSEDGLNYKKISINEKLCSFGLTKQYKIIAAFEKSIFLSDLNLKKIEKIFNVQNLDENIRLNDGKCDSYGRFIVGSYNKNRRNNTQIISLDNNLNLNYLINQIGCANSIEFSNCGNYFYYSDSLFKKIYKCDYDKKRGKILNNKIFVNLGSEEGFPDGSCIDNNNSLWNAQYNGNCVQEFKKNGSYGNKIHIPCPQVTCVCIGGKNLDIIFISTARENWRNELERQHSLAGSVFYAKLNLFSNAKGMEINMFNDDSINY